MKIAVCSYKGGVSKTVTSIHVAAALSAHGKVIVVDSDPNRQAYTWHRRGHLLFEVVSDTEAAMGAAVGYDHIIFDTKARVEKQEVLSLSKGCDLLIVPCPPDALALQAGMQMIEDLRSAGSNKFRILATMVPPPPNNDRQELLETLDAAKVPYFQAFIRRLIAFSRAAGEGKLVCDIVDPRAAAAWAGYEQVGKEILEMGRRSNG
jgi:chromosome partitioning protein